MALTPKLYLKMEKSALNKEIDMDSDTIKWALFSNVLSISQTADQYFDAAPYTSNQVPNSGGYTTGGVTISPGSISLDTTLRRVYFDFSDPVWNPITIASPGARYAVCYDATPASNKPLIMYVDLGGDQIFTNGIMTFALNSLGAGYLSVA